MGGIEIMYNDEKKEWRIYAPYCEIACDTETDFRRLQKAVRKQNSAKVRISPPEFKYGEYYSDACCPSCGLLLEAYVCGWDETGGAEIVRPTKHGCEGRNTYCNRCGQKLDWGTGGSAVKGEIVNRKNGL